MICNPNLRSSIPLRASSGCCSTTPSTFRARRVGIHAQQQVGRREVEETQRVRLHELRAVDQLAQLAARSGGMRTAMIASHAFDDASRWLIGQMPQMRDVIPGIS